jgi:HAD superfamily hydrolase (TIGR01549 family)
MQAAIDYLARIGHKDTYDLCFEVFHNVDAMSSQDLRRFVKPISGAAELVHTASAYGCKIAIATTDRRERAQLAMKYLGYGNEIDLIIGADDVKKQKPDPEQIQLILEYLRIDPLRAVMVGDALTDVKMGINAGVKASIGVQTGFATKEQLLEVTPYVTEDVSKIGITKRD